MEATLMHTFVSFNSRSVNILMKSTCYKDVIFKSKRFDCKIICSWETADHSLYVFLISFCSFTDFVINTDGIVST